MMKTTVAIIQTRDEPRKYVSGGTCGNPELSENIDEAIGFSDAKSALTVQRLHPGALSCTFIERDVKP